MKFAFGIRLICVCVFVVLEAGSAWVRDASEDALMHAVLSDVNPNVRPVSKYNDTITATISLAILSINELNVKDEVLDLSAWLELSWEAISITWDAEEYGGIQQLHVPAKRMWKPDIALYNSADTIQTVHQSPIVVHSNGDVLWITPIRLRARCSFDLRKFPFDKQSCILEFGSWMYNSYSLNLMMSPGHHFADLSNYQVNQQWTILDNKAKIKNEIYTCCPEVYQKFEVMLSFERVGRYYSYMFVLPAVFVGLLVPVQCLIPPDAEEKLSLGGALFISMVLLTSDLNEVLPGGHKELPYISIYYTMVIVWISLSLAVGMFIKHIASAKHTRRQVPSFIRQTILPFLRKVFFVEEGPCYRSTEVEATASPIANVYHEMDVKTTTESQAAIQDFGQIGKDVGSITSQVKSMMELQTQKESRIKNGNEWYQLAVVCDRLICVVCVLTVAIFCLAIFT